MKKIYVIIMILVILGSCEKNQDYYTYEATVVGMDECSDSYILNIHKLDENAQLNDGIYSVYGLRDKFTDEIPSFDYGYEGLRIRVRCSGLSNTESLCNFMGNKLPVIDITSAKIADNQNEGIDQRKINNSDICLPYRNVYGETDYDINGDSITDISFDFLNFRSLNQDSTFTYSNLVMQTHGNLSNYENGNYSIKQYGDTIKGVGPITGDWDRGFAGTFLVQYRHDNAIWNESILKFGESCYLTFQIQREDKFHSAWIKLLIENHDCMCVVSILDSYYNPEPGTFSIVGVE